MLKTKLAFSDHAQSRSQQRGVSRLVVDLILQFGAERHAGEGCISLWADRDSLREMQSTLGASLFRKLESQLRGVYLVVSGASVITVAHVR